MASAEREPITEVWGGAPSGVQGQSPRSGVREGHSPLMLVTFLYSKCISFALLVAICSNISC